jgi:hypothetical protein
MDTRDSDRIANALENIAHTLEKQKGTTSEFRIASLKRQSRAVSWIDARVMALEKTQTKTVHVVAFLRDLHHIRQLLLEN